MGTHLLAYFSNTTFGATLANVTVVNDDIVTKTGTGDRFLCPVDYNAVFAASALGTTLTRALFTTPSLEVRREVFEILPRAASAVVFAARSLQAYLPPQDLLLQAPENIICQTADSSGAGVAKYASIWLKKPGPIPPMATGDVRVARSTSATTLTANVWSTCAITLDKDFEPGTYQQVGLIGESANSIYARQIFPALTYRPGVPVLAGTEAAAADYGFAELLRFEYYNMGSFPHTNLPQTQFLSSAADTAEQVFLYVIKTGPPGTAIVPPGS